jgi:hypothetical protein
MQLPMTGSWLIEVKAVRPFSIHGDLYYELQAVRIDVPTTGDIVLRVPQHAAKTPPSVGQRLSVGFLMGQVTGVSAG